MTTQPTIITSRQAIEWLETDTRHALLELSEWHGVEREEAEGWNDRIQQGFFPAGGADEESDRLLRHLSEQAQSGPIDDIAWHAQQALDALDLCYGA